MIDYRERYMPIYRVKTDDYGVIEERSKRLVDKGPLSYGEAQDIADRENEGKAERVRAAISADRSGVL